MKKNLIKGLILFCAACFLLAACEEQAPDNNDNNPVRTPITQSKDATVATVYYATTDGQWLVPLTVPIQATREVARVALEKLLAGSPTDFASSPIPADTKLIDVFLTSSVVHVDLTDQFLNIDPERLPNAARAIAATVLPLTQVDQVQILVNGKPCPMIGDYDLSQPITLELLNVVNPEIEGNFITCYFSDNQGMYLVPLTYMIPENSLNIDDLKSELAGLVLDELTKGPSEDSGLFGTFWEGTEVNGYRLNDTTLEVDFSEGVIAYGGGTTAEHLFLKSLVYSLTAIEGIDAVQLFIEGEKVEYLPEGSDVDKPLTPGDPLNMVNPL